MPHATNEGEELNEQQEEELLQRLLDPRNEESSNLDFLSRELEPGEKADDAQDFEDIDDDDLAEDEDEINAQQQNQHLASVHTGTNGISAADGVDVDFDDLFGDDEGAPAVQEPPDAAEPDLDDLFGQLSSPPPQSNEAPTASASQLPESHSFEQTQALDEPSDDEKEADDVEEEEENDDPEFQAQWLEQQQLFAAAKQERTARTHPFDIPPPPGDDQELFKTTFPLFEEDKPVRWRKVLPQKRAVWTGRQPLKPPKPIQPTKVNLDLLQDQEKSFRLAGPSVLGTRLSKEEEAAQRGIILVEDKEIAAQESEDDFEQDVLDDNEMIGGFTWQDIGVACADWDISSIEDEAEYGDIDMPRSKRHKRFHSQNGAMLHRFYEDFPSLDDPEAATAKIAKKVTLDMNDSNLMLEVLDPDNLPKQPRKAGLEFKRDVGGSFSRALSKRFNISNDEAYDALKENHQQNKVRNLIGNESLEHSIPALRLQYPFYKVKLTPRECRSFHRPTLNFKPAELAKITKNRRQKRKNLKGKPIKEIFATAADLSLGDNSDMLLLEYSEEQPIMLSNFGMHTRLINYFRRKDDADTTRPKLPLGETSVLLPKDQGPFSIFGTVDPGETVPAITNQMFRAPVFQHEPKKTDFLVIRSCTGENGNSWHLRNIENLMVVGQQFPSMEVPGIHSRKVTEAAKNRLKMIAYRIYRTNSRKPVIRGAKLSNEMIREHLPGTDIAQNRGKLREFMQYDKERGSWNPYPADYQDDAPVESLRKIVPETICLIDSTQVGDQYLRDSGYSKGESDNEDGDGKEGESIEEQMAPWQLTKNFLNACQGKAMLELHGTGDPSSRGEAFSFIKTSMKGGFRAIGESVEDKLDAKRIKENGGHSYNVAKQQQKYEESIRKIWEAQKLGLGSTLEPEDAENDVDNVVEAADKSGRDFTPFRPGGSAFGASTPAHRDDDTMSQFSRLSRSSESGKILRITRRVPNAQGVLKESIEVVKDARVIREYMKRRSVEKLEELKKNLLTLKPTGDEHVDKLRIQALRDELQRLERNQERRVGREKAKGIYNPSTADTGSPSATTKPVGTQRKCKRCGQVGHISTNKKLCPMQNGTIKGPEESETAFPQPTI